MTFKNLLFILTPFLCFQFPAKAQDYTKSEYSQWTDAFKAGKIEQVIEETEKDLTGTQPNHFTMLSWVTARKIQGDLESAINHLSGDQKSKARLYADILHFENEDMAFELFDTYTIDRLKALGGVNINYSWSDRVEMIAPEQSYELTLHTLKQYGEYFRTAWTVNFLGRNHLSVFYRIHEDLAAGAFDKFPNVKAFLEKASETPYEKDLDELIYLEKFLEEYPEDAQVWRYKGHKLLALKRYAEAGRAYKNAWEIDPYYSFGLNLLDAVNSYARANRLEDAQELLRQYTRLYYPEEQDMEFITRWANNLIGAGRNNEAREILEENQAQYQNDPEFQLALGKLEEASGRDDFALKHFENAFRTGPKTLVYYTELVDAYMANGKSAEALEVIRRLESGRKLPLDFYYKKARIFEEAGEYEEAYRVRKESVEVYPNSSWHWNNYAYVSYRTERYDEAFKAITKSADLSKPSSWASGRLYDYTKARFDHETALAKVEEYAKKYHWNENLWKVYASHFKSLSQKEEVYERALESSGNYFFPYKLLIDEYLKNYYWNEAENILQLAHERLNRPDDLKELAYYEAEILRRKGQRERLDAEEINRAMKAHQRYANITGTKDHYWYRDMAAFLIYKNDRSTSAQYLDSGLMVNPDSRIIMSKIRNSNLGEYGAGKLSKKLWEYLERDPYDIDRYLDAINFHIKWGGSPLVAIVLSQQAKELIPDDYPKVKNHEVMAYGHLGDNVKEFEILYARDNVISSSERYIEWYNNSRHSVWEGSSTITVDPETAIATIQFPDGTMAQRQDDLITGKVKMLKVGDAFIKADYTDNGELTNLHSSNGRNVDLTYNEHNQITAIHTSEGKDLAFEYNEKGKPVLMKLKGTGYMEVNYNEYGDVMGVYSYDENGNEAGTQMASEITSTFQELTSLTNTLQKARTLSNAKLPDLGIIDQNYAELASEWYELGDQLYEQENKKTRAEWFEKTVEFARYLKDHTHVNADYAGECFEIIEKAKNEFEEHKNKKILEYGPQLAEIFHELLIKTRRNGVAGEWWNAWIGIREWLEKEKQEETRLTRYRKSIEKLQNKFLEQPVELLSTSEWLPKSILQNDGFWKKYILNDIVQNKYFNNLTVNVLYKRYNGDILLGTNRGLLVRHRGYWDHVSFNPLHMEMEREMDPSQIKASSNIISITETNDNLILGTADGLLILEGEKYVAKVIKRISQLDGLPVSAINHVQTLDEKIYLGTARGLVIIARDSITLHDQITSNVTCLQIGEVWDEGTFEYSSRVLLGTDDALWLTNDKEIYQKIMDTPVDDALLDQEGMLFILQNNRVYRYEQGVFIELMGNIITTDANQVFGLAEISVKSLQEDSPEGLNAVGVLTDMGISLYHNRHFEHFYLPLKGDVIPQARKYAGNYESFSVFTGNEVYAFELDQTYHIKSDKVFDILNSDSVGLTYVAQSSGLYYFDHNTYELPFPGFSDDYNRQELDYIYPTALALDSKGRLITNDGRRILRYTFITGIDTHYPEEDEGYDNSYLRMTEANKFEVEELFYANQFEPDDASWIQAGGVKNIIVARDGTIWVATKLSVFRYKEEENGEVTTEEYNYFRSPEIFPSRTHMIYRVLELPDGRILVVCSDEGHLEYNGVYLDGGLLQWNENEKRFVALNIENNYRERGFNWFLTSVTEVGEDKAIAGTLGGFAEYNQGEIKDYYAAGGGIVNSSYNSIYEEKPALFMGTRGDNIGDLWLFGCASGVLAYHNGVWFYPDRLNQMLPKDMEYGNYGGRHINAIATDKGGRIYAGTDLGLLIYDSKGADPMSFLINNDRVEDAFSTRNELQLQQERESVIKSIPKSTRSGQAIAEIDDIEKEIRRLEHLKADHQEQLMGRSESPTYNRDSLTTLIANKQKKHYELLLKLEKQDPAIHQLLDIKPVEVASLRRNLREGECLVQYIPTKEKLYIQVLAKDKIVLRETVVSKDSLMKMSRYMANGFRYKLEMDEMETNLAWLYDQLLRPVQNDIAGYEHIMVIPVQSLYYIPFGALVDKINEKEWLYALEKYNIAYVSSTYLMGLLVKTQPQTSDRYLLMGDPDGTLPGADEEIKAISQITENENIFLKNNATFDNLVKNAFGARVVHMATHGYLNNEAPGESSILLADKKLIMPEIFNLPLDKTEMIILSACETGKGADNGMEYATIARAFANAGSPTVLATLWKVNDAATLELMVNFYKELKNDKSNLQALISAQRKFLKENEEYVHPYYWAAFIMMGKP